MTDFLNVNVPVANSTTTPFGGQLYPWMRILAGGGTSEFSEVRMRGDIYDKDGILIVGGGGGGGGNVPVGTVGQTVTYNALNNPIAVSTLTNNVGNVGINQTATHPLEVSSVLNVPIFQVKSTGAVVSLIPNYTSLVTADGVFTNKGYVDQVVSANSFPAGTEFQSVTYDNLNAPVSNDVLKINTVGNVGINHPSTPSRSLSIFDSTGTYNMSFTPQLDSINLTTSEKQISLAPVGSVQEDYTLLLKNTSSAPSGSCVIKMNDNFSNFTSTIIGNDVGMNFNLDAGISSFQWNADSDPLLRLGQDGVFTSEIASYTSTITQNKCITNKEYVDQVVSGITISELGDIPNVDDTAKVDNSILIYDTGTAKWRARANFLIDDNLYNMTMANDKLELNRDVAGNTKFRVKPNTSGDGYLVSSSFDGKDLQLISNTAQASLQYDSSQTTGLIVKTGTNNLFRILPNGTISAMTANYEGLVLLNNDIPNRKFVTDTVGAVLLSDLDDVAILAPVGGDWFIYNTAIADWRNRKSNDGQIRVNGFNTNITPNRQPTYILLGGALATPVNYTFPAETFTNLNVSAFPITSPPLNASPYADSQIYRSGTLTFVENEVLGQVNIWRFILNYINKSPNGDDGLLTLILTNNLSGFVVKGSFPLTKNTSAENDRYTEILTIADNSSLPAPTGSGSGYLLSIQSTLNVTVTITSITRINTAYTYRT